jgi:hypothetical protein
VHGIHLHDSYRYSGGPVQGGSDKRQPWRLGDAERGGAHSASADGHGFASTIGIGLTDPFANPDVRAVPGPIRFRLADAPADIHAEAGLTPSGSDTVASPGIAVTPLPAGLLTLAHYAPQCRNANSGYTEHSYSIGGTLSSRSATILFTGVENNNENTSYVVGRVELDIG